MNEPPYTPAEQARPFTFTGARGTRFTCVRLDFSGPIRIRPSTGVREWVLKYLAEMIAHHVLTVHPRLSGFGGYDTLSFIEE